MRSATYQRVPQVMEDLVSLQDHERRARTVLDDPAWAYISGGAADELTVRANCDAWQQVKLLPRVLRQLAGGHTRVELLGRTLAHPILLAPVAHQAVAHADAELACACAASALGAGFILSTQANTSLESVARVMLADAQRGPLWFQLYWQHDRGFLRELIGRAEQAGYEALVLTVDAPVSGTRDRERRSPLRLPPGVRAVNLDGLEPAPRIRPGPGQSALFDDVLTHAPVWDDVSWLASETRLPVLLKGVMHPDDARQAVRIGAAGLIVSNHGGRTLDTAVPTAEILPAVVDAVGNACPVLVDGGIRRGSDVLKAMALGASAVLLGRPYIYGLANAGAVGVAHVLRLLRDELEVAMALCGCRQLDQAPQCLLNSRQARQA